MRRQCLVAAEWAVWAVWISSPHLNADNDRKALGFLRAFFSRQKRETGMQQMLRPDKHCQQAMPHFASRHLRLSRLPQRECAHP